MNQITVQEIIIEEMNRKEALQAVAQFIEDANAAGIGSVLFVWIEYNDGKFYSNSEGVEEGSFKKSGIKGMILDNGATYQIFGKYEVTNSIPDLI